MLNAHKLSKEEMRTHIALIERYAKEVLNLDNIPIKLAGWGFEKGVYKIEVADKSFLAAAAIRNSSHSLLEEYNILSHLYKNAPKFFPEARGHVNFSNGPVTGELLIMEYIPLPTLNDFKNSNQVKPTDYFRKLAYELGASLAVVNTKTGMYPSEPHDGNVFINSNGNNISLKFCDAIQYKRGCIEDTALSCLDYGHQRMECTKFPHKFREGLISGLVASGMPEDKAKEQIDPLKKYSSI
jgi:hypothetical protein